MLTILMLAIAGFDLAVFRAGALWGILAVTVETGTLILWAARS